MSEHAPDPIRPQLTADLEPVTFAAWYWLKSELIAFCRTAGLGSTGDKRTVQARIEQHLVATQRLVATQSRCVHSEPSADAAQRGITSVGGRANKRGRRSRPPSRSSTTDAMPDSFSHSTIIGRGWRCTNALRAFFVAELGKRFRFNGALRDFIHANAGKTLADALVIYRSSSNQPTSEIGAQFEYNRHMRAFFRAHRNATPEQARAAWWAERNRPKTRDRS